MHRAHCLKMATLNGKTRKYNLVCVLHLLKVYYGQGVSHRISMLLKNTLNIEQTNKHFTKYNYYLRCVILIKY